MKTNSQCGTRIYLPLLVYRIEMVRRHTLVFFPFKFRTVWLQFSSTSVRRLHGLNSLLAGGGFLVEGAFSA